MARYVTPVLALLLFVVLVGFLARGLFLDPREVPSPFIGKPAPAFNLPTVADPSRSIGTDQLRNRVTLLNVWASWCVSCRAEHPLLVDLARRGGVAIYGLNYKDTRADAQRWLATLGNPYTASAFDEDGRIGIEWGVYGVPETFVIDSQGIIRHKHTGPITADVWEKTLWPLIQKLQAPS
jgi:cytochrome c biogenesis protein CcmG/thiol:disulfide interchange protein DsbE